jgi:hypothetical protein
LLYNLSTPSHTVPYWIFFISHVGNWNVWTSFKLHPYVFVFFSFLSWILFFFCHVDLSSKSEYFFFFPLVLVFYSNSHQRLSNCSCFYFFMYKFYYYLYYKIFFFIVVSFCFKFIPITKLLHHKLASLSILNISFVRKLKIWLEV